MKFISTRGGSPPLRFSEALVRGLAPDGGLYVPDSFPRVSVADFDPGQGIATLVEHALAPYFAGDPLQDSLGAICAHAFNFPIPLIELPATRERPRAAILELFHGPTAAFKDVGARFLGACLEELGGEARTILVATSGDTGGAVAAALHGLEHVEVCILYPLGGVSPEQEQQLTCWDGNVRAFAVRGSFDDCQALLKQALLKQALAKPDSLGARALGTANSINVARVLGQLGYYALASVECLERTGAPADFVVPTGNLGNATAALWARRMGFPIGRVLLATNANRVVPDFLGGAEWSPRASLPTLANAMDVGDPSNMERVFHLFPDPTVLRRELAAWSVSDAEIRATIAAGPERWGRILDPHTATAVFVVEQHELQNPVIVSTAHPAKFARSVQALVDVPIELPSALAALAERPTHSIEIDPSLAALKAAMNTGA